MTDTTPLFKPLQLGAIEASNRVLMAPLTRNRAQSDGVPKDMAVDYYRQRAGAGLIITEATQISPRGKGYIDTPGIHSEAQTAAWKKIVDAVHQAGGKIAVQLWHVGRISHTSLQPDGQQPLAPSAIRAQTQTFTANGFEDTSEPVAMTEHDIEATIDDFVQAARNADAAGFDLVEVHAANGYLIDQFLQDRTNTREDVYGGSIENRMRFLNEVLDAVSNEIGSNRVGVRLSPLGQFNDMGDSDPEALFGHVYAQLSNRDLAYLHVMENFPGSERTSAEEELLDRIRTKYTGNFIVNGGFDANSGAQFIADGKADAIAYGRPFIANPDLPERYRLSAELNVPDEATFYGGGREGYTDYPALDLAA